jgi:hypothetical protein
VPIFLRPPCGGRPVGLESDRSPVQGVPHEHHEDYRIAGNSAETRTGYFPNTKFTTLQPGLLDKDDMDNEDGRGSISSRNTTFHLGRWVWARAVWVSADLWGKGKAAKT